MSDETCCGACGYPVHATKESACDWCRQSADRIEALTAKIKLLDDLDAINGEKIEALTKERDQHWDSFVHWRKEADDLSEQLSAARQDAKEAEAYAEEVEAKGLANRVAIMRLEAKLAENEVRLRKAVEALDMLVRDCEADYPPSHGAIKHFAIATLAAIKGESHE